MHIVLTKIGVEAVQYEYKIGEFWISVNNRDVCQAIGEYGHLKPSRKIIHCFLDDELKIAAFSRNFKKCNKKKSSFEITAISFQGKFRGVKSVKISGKLIHVGKPLL